MPPTGYSFAILLLWFLISCGHSQKTNTISDYREDLQPHLQRIVTEGQLAYGTIRNIRSLVTDKELIQLTRSEHPLLRAFALEQILNRPLMEHFNLMMSHLDDTALVYVDHGEFGFQPQFVSDYMIENGKWATYEMRDKTAEEILKNHPYLISAFSVPDKMELKDSHLPYIRKIAEDYARHQGTIRFDHFYSFQNILYSLASFKKKEDIPLIVLAMEYWQFSLTRTSFLAMQFFQDTAYLKLLEKYALEISYSPRSEESDVADCLEAIASYQNEESRKILEKVFLRTFEKNADRYPTPSPYSIYSAIMSYECPVYDQLKKRIRPYMKTEIIAYGRNLPLKVQRYPVDKTKGLEPVNWH
jgi:hypothetical protein